MLPDRIALIDMGTNTFHLLITELQGAKPVTLLKLKQAVKLGNGGITEGKIAPDAYQRALDTISFYKTEAERFGVQHIYAVATSAVRCAANGPELVQTIKEQTGIEADIISGEQEAAYIYEGVKTALNIGAQPSLIMDIGGGSVEFIICTQEGIIWKRSFELGAQRLLDAYHLTDPISEEDQQRLLAYLHKQLQPLSQAMAIYKPEILIGSSGTFDTLCDIATYKKGALPDPDFIEGNLSLTDYQQIRNELLSKNREQRLNVPGMIELRADMIVVALVLIDYVLQEYNLQQIRVSSYALKEGLLSLLLTHQYHHDQVN